jgi:hypothetical protein
MLFLHGDGERGVRQSELDYVLIARSVLFEGWCQSATCRSSSSRRSCDKFSRGEIPYIKNRDATKDPASPRERRRGRLPAECRASALASPKAR